MGEGGKEWELGVRRGECDYGEGQSRVARPLSPAVCLTRQGREGREGWVGTGKEELNTTNKWGMQW